MLTGYTTADSILDSFEAASSIIVRRNIQTMNNILHKQTGIHRQTLNKQVGKVYDNDFQQ